MACGHSSRGTGSITEEFHAGVSMAVQHPPTNTSSSTVAGPPQPSSTSSVSRAKAAVWAISAPEMRRRRSLVSANTPAGRASKNMGRNTAVCTSAARKEEPVSSTISQAAAMACMPLPTKNTPPHSQSPRKAGWRRGLHKEVEEDMAAKWGRKPLGQQRRQIGRWRACPPSVTAYRRATKLARTLRAWRDGTRLHPPAVEKAIQSFCG